jgi:hypothetical protein
MSSTLSLPGYTVDPKLQTPAYTAEPQLHETTLSRGRGGGGRRASPSSSSSSPPPPLPPPPFASSAEFVKESKRAGLRLRLSGQPSHDVVVPVFSTRGPVQGTLELLKPPSQDLVYVAVRVSVVFFFFSFFRFVRI